MPRPFWVRYPVNSADDKICGLSRVIGQNPLGLGPKARSLGNRTPDDGSVATSEQDAPACAKIFFFSVVDDPTMTEFQGRALGGSYGGGTAKA